MLKPDAPEEFEPASALSLHYDQPSADALQVTVNGRALKTPTDTTTWTITKDNYRQFAPVMSLITKGSQPGSSSPRGVSDCGPLELFGRRT